MVVNFRVRGLVEVRTSGPNIHVNPKKNHIKKKIERGSDAKPKLIASIPPLH